MNHIPESPSECEALLAEALETLAKFPTAAGIVSSTANAWYWERAKPTINMIEAFLNPDSVTPLHLG